MNDPSSYWRKYLIEIIDGKYSLDIQKIGDSASFLKNQIESFEFPNTEYDNFIDSLCQIIDETSFAANQIVNDANKYLYLLDWGNRFISARKPFLKNLVALQFSFESFNISGLTEETRNQIELLLIKSSFGIVEYIDNWNNHNKMFPNENILEKIQYIDAIKSLWEIKINQTNELKDFNIIKGLILLNVWNQIEQPKRKQFFIINKNNKQLFSAILFELKRAEKHKTYNYYPIIEDITLYHSDFINVIYKNCSSWLSKEKSEINKKLDSEIKLKHQSQENFQKYNTNLENSLKESLHLASQKN